jgi:MinD-like ATPase involved in chromosome partitioning or flagellar assembly
MGQRVISIGGASGGVGKSTVVANIAVACAQRGVSVVLVECAGLGSIQRQIFGLDGAAQGSTLAGAVAPLSQRLRPTSIPNLHLLSERIAVESGPNPTMLTPPAIRNRLRDLQVDLVLLDCGPANTNESMDLFASGDVRVAVIAPKLEVLQSAYAFVKGTLSRSLSHLAETDEERAFLATLASGLNARASTVLARIGAGPPALARRAADHLTHFGLHFIGNRALDEGETNVCFAVCRMVRDFLGVEANLLGTVPPSEFLENTQSRAQPLLAEGRLDDASRALRKLAEGLLAVKVPERAPPAAPAQPAVTATPESGAAGGEAKPDGAKTDAAKTDGAKTDAAKTDGAKTDGAKTDAAEATAAVAADGVQPAQADPQLPDIQRFQRRWPRHPVAWTGTFNGIPVEIVEVSLGGASIKTPVAIAIGTESRLTVKEVRGSPSLRAVVRGVRAAPNILGLMFPETGETNARLVSTALASNKSGRDD